MQFKSIAEELAIQRVLDSGSEEARHVAELAWSAGYVAGSNWKDGDERKNPFTREQLKECLEVGQ